MKQLCYNTIIRHKLTSITNYDYEYNSIKEIQYLKLE